MRLAAAALLVLAAGCGDDDEGVVAGSTTPGGETTTTSGGEGGIPVETTQLTVERADLGESATLQCGETAVGSGWLADPAAAEAACALVTGDADAQRLLTERPDADRQCTQIYGGPEEAAVTGSLQDGRSVRARFARSDGCGIADWEKLQALLGAPGQ